MKENTLTCIRDGGAMISVTPFAKPLRQILENELGKKKSSIERERTISGAGTSPNAYLLLVGRTRDHLRRLDADCPAERSGDQHEWLASSLYARSRRLFGASVGAAHPGAPGSGDSPGRAAPAFSGDHCGR